MQICSNVDGDHITFKYYYVSEDVVLDIFEDYTFVINDIIGDVVDLWIINVGVLDFGCFDCVDDDVVMVVFGGCVGVVVALGCDFVFGGVFIGDLCFVFCGICFEEDECGVCEGDGSSCIDCESGVYDCVGVCDGELVEDCVGECGGIVEEDECGNCGGSGFEEGFICNGVLLNFVYNQFIV